MRTLNPSLALASLVGFLAAVSCTLITDVDRTKIPTDAGAEGGSPGTGGTSGTGGTGETGGTGGTSMGGEAGQNPSSGGSAGTTGGKGGSSGKGGSTAGSGGSMHPTEVCKQPTGSITLKPMTLFADGDTITLHDGVNHGTVFEMDLDTKPGVASGNWAIVFNGREDQYGLASLIRDAINQAHQDGTLRIAATTSFTYLESGATGDAGGGGAPAAGGASNGGEAGAPDLTLPAVIQLTNDLAGDRGNLNITETAGNPNFSVSGMSGGEAVACSKPTSCSSNAECSGTCGSNHICK